jgi:hypothetical protein
MDSRDYSKILRSNLTPHRELKILDAVKTLRSEGIHVVNALFSEARYARDRSLEATAKSSEALAFMLVSLENNNSN